MLRVFRVGVDICGTCGTTGRYDCPDCGIVLMRPTCSCEAAMRGDVEIPIGTVVHCEQHPWRTVHRGPSSDC